MTTDTATRATPGDLIRTALRVQDMTVPDLSRRINRSTKWIYGVIAGYDDRKLTSPETIDELCKVLAIEPYDLYAAAGVIPPDLFARITTSKDTLHAASNAVDRVLAGQKG